MKKALIIILSAVLFVSCSNDENNDTIKPDFDNMAGTWYMSQVIQPDGTLKGYVGDCPEKRDYFIISRYAQINSYFSYGNCINTNSIYGSSRYYIESGNMLTHGGEILGGKITLSKTSLRLDYGEVRHFNQPSLDNSIGIILTRE